ncbi:MAG TPA: class I adenylate-forming enzyme family protein [Polyangia bacterium]|jgi:acyl-CoA synthetase (AMP-forming)/AMP-acid ligase II|nr:class I adenylate-forming enzyme family protein [Polyangia bacterium]
MIGPLSERDITQFFGRTVEIVNEPLREPPFTELGLRWRELGLRPGDLVLLALPSSVALLQHFFGVLAAGGVPAMLAPGAPAARLREMAKVMGARVVATVRLPNGLRPGSTDAGGDGGGLPVRLEQVGGLETAWYAPEGVPAANPGEVVLLTSGTSGTASGCVTSIEAMLRNGARHADAVGQRPEDCVLINLPLYFSFALVAQALGSLGRGNRLVIGGPPFNHVGYARTLAEHGVTVSALTPIQARTLLQHKTALPASLRVLSIGGDSLAPPHVAELLQLRPGAELYLTYGLTQAGPRVATLAAHNATPARYASVGLPLPGTRVWLDDVGDGSGRRELLVWADTLMRRRIGLVEGRRSNDFRPIPVAGSATDLPPDSLALATGDVFDQDSEGYLFYRGRLSHSLLRAGEKISLATVQRLATQLPAVISAKTRVTSTEDGEDFDLVLVVANVPARQSAEQYRTLLAHSIRRAELPRSIEVVVDDASQALGYK